MDLRRRVPSVEQLLRQPEARALADRLGRERVLCEARALLETARRRAAEGDAAGLDRALDSLAEDLRSRVETAAGPSLVTVVNATGVVVHTNLGRAPLSAQAAARVAQVAAAYSNLEFDLAAGARGDREVHAETRLRALLGAEAALVVNNNAAAVLLAVNTFAEGREVLVSRGELVEIGGSFRIPDVLRKGGARLREVGTTNRTRIADYRAALSPEAALILKVHPSNFKIVGFTETPERKQLVELAREAGLPLVEDLGSGLIEPLPGLESEPVAGPCLAAGVDVVTFSGDKLLGGPQAGLVAGRRPLLDAMRKNPLYRALRVDKMTMAALDTVLAEHQAGHAAQSVPVLRMLAEDVATVRARAEAFVSGLRTQASRLGLAVVEGSSAVGGGAAPSVAIPSALVVVDHPTLSPDALASALRAGHPPIVARVAEDRLVLDLRTVLPEQEGVLRDALAALA